MGKKNVKMTVSIELEIPDSIKADNLFADLAALQLYQKKGKDERVYVGNGIKVVEFKTESVEYAPGQKPIPEKLAALVEKYAVHEDILEEIRQGSLEFLAESEGDCPELTFAIPELSERDSSAILHWHGMDPKTWSLGNIRFYAQREYDGHGDEELWSPERGEDDDQPFSKYEDDGNVESFISWLHDKLEGY